MDRMHLGLAYAKRADELYARGEFVAAVNQYEAAWQIWGIELNSRKEFALSFNRGRILMNWARTLHALRNYAEAAEKYETAWRIWGIELKDRPELHADRATLLMNWAITLSTQGHYPEAVEKYKAAWQIWGVELKDRPGLHRSCARLLMNWANTLASQGHYSEAAGKYQAAWKSWGVDLKDRPELQANRATLLMNWAIALRAQGRYSEAAKKHEAAWQIWGVDLKDQPERDADRARLLMSWANTLQDQACYSEAAEKYQAAWQIWGIDLKDRPTLQANRARLLMNWAATLRALGHYSQSAEKCQTAWRIWGIEFKDCPELHADRARLLMNWANTLHAQGHSLHAGQKYEEAWQIWGVDLKDRPELHANRARLLMNWAATLRSQGFHSQAADKYRTAWQIWGTDLKERPELHASRARLLMNWANTLRAQAHYSNAAEKYEEAWQIWGIDLKDRPELHANRAALLMNWASTVLAQGYHPQATEKYRAAWLILAVEHSDRRETDNDVAKLAQNWQKCWTSMEDRQGWAREVSTELCRRLGAQNLANPPHWLDELYGRFGQFHLRWMQDSLSDGEPEHLVEILSRVSSWRMATALLDELETQASQVTTQDATLDSTGTSAQSSESKDTQTLRHYQRLRLEVRRRIQQLHEKEHAAGHRGTDGSGVRGDGLAVGLGLGLGIGQDRPARSAEDQARLDAEINALRAEYDAVYRDMQQAQAVAAMVPGYAALSVDRSTLNSQQLLAQLSKSPTVKKAMLIVFDQKAHGDTPLASPQQLSGALLLANGKVHWQPIPDIAQGSAYLAQYERWVEPNSTKGMAFRRGDTDRGDSVSNGDTDSPTLERELLNDQGLAITRESLWPSLGEWVKRTLWQPLAKQGLLNGVDEIVLVTQGQDAHSIPWQMGAPVAATAIKRYPGLMFYAMDTELLSRAACHEDAALGVAHYKGQERALPFARIEAKTLCEIWTQAGHPVQQDFDYLRPTQRVGSVHVAGHGNHAMEVKQTAAAAACLSVGENTRWGLSELMNSPARPKQVYLSCCVAGRTTDLAGEQYGVTAALLQHGTREVVASYVSLEDTWGSALSIVTHSLMSQHGLDMKHALDRAQAMVTGQLPWDETAKAWVLKGWRERLIELIAQMLEKRQTEVMSMDSAESLAVKIANRIQEEVFDHLPHLARERLDQESYLAWYQALARDFFDAGAGRTWTQERQEKLAAGYADKLLQHAQWCMQPPALIAGSLAFATTAVGG